MEFGREPASFGHLFHYLQLDRMSLLCTSKGFKIDGLSVPPFLLNQGEWIVLQLPIRFGSKLEMKINKILTGDVCPGFIRFANVEIAVPIGNTKSGEEFLNIGQFLERLPARERDLFIAEINDSEISLEALPHHLPGTPRLLAGLMLASLGANLVVFNTCGLDPTGVQNVYDYVSEKMKHGIGFLEIQFEGVGPNHSRPFPVPQLTAELQTGLA